MNRPANSITKKSKTIHMASYVLAFKEIDRTMPALAGGKGANLGELAKIDGIHVPDGFCVSTEAYKSVIDGSPVIGELLQRLSLLTIEDHAKSSRLSNAIREAIEALEIPQEIQDAVVRFLGESGSANAYAVRSSATAEDLP